MNLKKFEVSGFKSFADKLSIEFDDGVTAIVGPNGCGKSNVVEAFKWVLGEQAPKNLRASKMTDVIFNGTEKRKSLSFCQVSLYIDNSNRILPKSAFDEVIISRKLYRSGQSEYLLNNETVRLADILDLIRDTGLGKDGYSIVGQGKIDEIMNAKPENRRSIFEDAAGILTYKKRKNDTQNKLNSANDSIEKLSLIMGGLERQLGPLERQSEAAKKYLAIRDRLRVLEVNEYLHRCDTGEEQKEKVRQKIAGLAEELAGVESGVADVEREYTSKMIERRNIDVHIGKLRDEQTRLAVEQESVRGKGNTLAERISGLNEQKRASEQRAVSLEEQLETKAEELSDLVNHLSMANEDKRELEAEIAGIEKKYLTLVDEIVGRERDIENTNRAMMEALASIADIKADKGKLGAERDAALQRIGELESECDVIKRTLENDEKAKREHEQSAERKLQQKNKLAKNKNEVAEEAADVELKAEAKRRNIENLRSEISALETKRRLLEEFSNTPSSRLISAAKRDPAVSKKIVGMVAELISVPKEYEVAIETALGSSLQNIVTRNEDDAKALIAYLKANGLGRVTFLPMTSYKARDLDAYQLPILRERGCVGVASKLIRYDKAYENIVSGLLGRTVICDTIDNAVAIARRYSYSVKIVTLGGDVLNTTGSMTGGSRSSRTSILAQEREIAEAKQSIADKTAQLKKLQDTMSEDSAYVRELQEQLAEYEEEVKAAEVAYATELERLDRICAKINDALAELENKGKMLELLNGKLAAIEANLSEIDRSESDISGVRTDADDKASRTKAEFEEKKRLRDKYSEDLTARRIELANAAAAAEKVGGDIDRVKRECTELKEQLNESKSEIAVLATRIAQAESGLNNAVVSDKDKERYEKIKKDIADANEYKSGLDEKLNELTARKDELQKQTVSLSEAKVKQEAALERIDDTLNALGEHLREEYGIESYADAQAYRADDFDVASAAGEITKLKRERSALGSVNLEAIEQFREVGAEYEQQKKEYDDLIAAREDFEKIIADLSKQMLERFNAEFVKIQDNFREIFRELFGGGTGKLELEPPENGDMLEAGVEIYAQPPGKLLKSMSLLSGGEKALTAIAILFSILKLRPMPFVILDETEAALDESNVEVFARYLKKFSGNTQFIVVTHRKPTMELADRLYGVTMQEKGVSTIVTVSLSEAVRHSSNDA